MFKVQSRWKHQVPKLSLIIKLRSKKIFRLDSSNTQVGNLRWVSVITFNKKWSSVIMLNMKFYTRMNKKFYKIFLTILIRSSTRVETTYSYLLWIYVHLSKLTRDNFCQLIPTYIWRGGHTSNSNWSIISFMLNSLFFFSDIVFTIIFTTNLYLCLKVRTHLLSSKLI